MAGGSCESEFSTDKPQICRSTGLRSLPEWPSPMCTQILIDLSLLPHHIMSCLPNGSRKSLWEGLRGIEQYLAGKPGMLF